MKAVILAGGLGSRLSEETTTRPKPMVEIGGQPILWHIMRSYAAFGVTDFIVCLGYRGYVVKEYFANYVLHRSNVTFDLRANTVEVHDGTIDAWRVTLVDTGAETMTGGRILRVLPYVGNETFCLTYGDGVADVDIGALVAFHRGSGALVTMTSVQPPPRFGSVQLDGDHVVSFAEKAPSEGAWINGGFFVVEAGVGEYLHGDGDVWEREPLEAITAAGKLAAFRHRGFWHPMDTVRDRRYLEELWLSGDAPWTKAW